MKLRLDGIIFPSAQISGNEFNIVLFHHSSKVKKLILPKNIQLEANSGYSNEDGWEVDYSVREIKKTDKIIGVNLFDSTQIITSSSYWEHDEDNRVDTLDINLKTVKVYSVKSVDYNCEEYEITRYTN